MASVWGELKRRNVVKVAVAYAIVGWLLIEVSSVLGPALSLPDWVTTFVAFLLILGFPVALLLSWAYELTPEGMKKTKSVALSESITHVTGRKLDFAIIGALVLALGFVVYNYVLVGADEVSVVQETTPTVEPTTESPVSVVAEEQREVLPNSVAVLLFDNLSPNPDDAYFAAGLHDEILNQLNKLSNLSAISRTSVLRYVDSNLSIPEIARELNVETVMEGSVRYANNRVRITTQLIDAETDEHLWSETYDRDFDDVFAIESDIAMNIANALEAEFSLAEQAAIEKQPTESAAAYALYLRAISRTADSAEAVSDLNQATALDPEFGLAYAAKASYQSALLLGFGASPAEAAELEVLARESAERALELDSTLGLAHAALGAVHIANWRGAAAEEALQVAFQVSPNSAAVLNTYARFKRYRGQYAEAIELMQQAVKLDPNNPGRHINLGVAYRFARDFGPAAASYRKALEFDPTSVGAHINLAIAEAALGNNAESLRLLRLAETLSGEIGLTVFRTAQMALTYSQAGSSEEAQRLFDELQGRAREESIGEAIWARAYMAIGDYEQALQHLEMALQERVPTDVGTLVDFAANAGNDPYLDADPRFQELLSGLWDEE